jgi:hypothetical protein
MIAMIIFMFLLQGTGFEGDQCELEVDDCAESSCLNNGTCVDRLNGFNCTCLPGRFWISLRDDDVLFVKRYYPHANVAFW